MGGSNVLLSPSRGHTLGSTAVEVVTNLDKPVAEWAPTIGGYVAIVCGPGDQETVESEASLGEAVDFFVITWRRWTAR